MTIARDAETSLRRGLDPFLARVARRRARHGRPAPQILISAPDVEFRSGDQALPFHAASVGKLATTVITMQLVESGDLELDAPIESLLPADELAGVFLDSASGSPVTVAHLLGHTSGAADYFDGPVTSGSRFVAGVISDPDHEWDPAQLVAFSRDRQRPGGTPGERFTYSDTGFVVLGRLIEEVTGSDFTSVLRSRVFERAGMAHSAFWLREPGPSRIAPLWINRTELSERRALTCDWAGGGIVTTVDDLALLVRATFDGTLVGRQLIERAATPRERFRRGIRYGLGVMELRLGEFMPLARGLPAPVGHLGVTGVHGFLDRATDTVVAMNFHDTAQMVPSFEAHLRAQQLLRRARR